VSTSVHKPAMERLLTRDGFEPMETVFGKEF
jgi:hypothetical protein